MRTFTLFVTNEKITIKGILDRASSQSFYSKHRTVNSTVSYGNKPFREVNSYADFCDAALITKYFFLTINFRKVIAFGFIYVAGSYVFCEFEVKMVEYI